MNLAAKTLKEKTDDIEDKMNFYSYDVTLNGVPDGMIDIKYLKADSKFHYSGWSAIYLFPADLKTQSKVLHMQYVGAVIADLMIEYIKMMC